MTYTYDHPSRTYDGEWSTTYDGDLDRGTVTGTNATTATIGLSVASASATLSTARVASAALATTAASVLVSDSLVSHVEVSDVDL